MPSPKKNQPIENQRKDFLDKKINQYEIILRRLNRDIKALERANKRKANNIAKAHSELQEAIAEQAVRNRQNREQRTKAQTVKR